MKSLRVNFAVLALAGLSYACGGGEKATETSAETTAAAPEATEVSLEDKYKDDPVYIKGLEKVKDSGCTTCHQVERKVVGPSYAEVAARYKNTEDDVTMLAKKVIAGGAGVWGEVPMSPHPNLTEEDAKDMVRYILLLRK